jgi:hypothetical protein
MKNIATLALLLLSAPLLAQDDAEETSTQTFTVHGYLTQAFAQSNGEQLIGIGASGTTDYRRAAALLRFTPTAKDTLVIQVAHRRLGQSPSLVFEPDVKLDWAFYERKLSDSTAVRVGRLPQPMGILNETRYVGTLLPFYRAPYNFYQEGSFTSETVDGVGLTHSTSPERPWSAEASVYVGGYSMVEQTENGLVKPRAEKVLGGQLWLSTPVSGLRFGIGGQRLDITGSALVRDGKDSWKTDYASVEYAGSRLKLRSEYRKIRIQEADVDFIAVYGYAGFNATSRLGLHLQFDTSKLELNTRAGRPFTAPKYYEDKTVGATFSLRPDVVLKGEYHWTQSQVLETHARPVGPAARPVNYGIVSMSVSF